MKKIKVSKKLIKKVGPFYAINWDYNNGKSYKVNVLSYIIDDIVKELESTNKHDITPIKSYDSFRIRVRSNLIYYFWSKREWEIAVGDLPSSYSDKDKYINSLEKISVYDQIEPNLDFIVDYLWNTLEVEDFLKRKYGDE